MTGSGSCSLTEGWGLFQSLISLTGQTKKQTLRRAWKSQGLTSHLFPKAPLLGTKGLRRGSRESKRKGSQLQALASWGSHQALQKPDWVSLWSAPRPPTPHASLA